MESVENPHSFKLGSHSKLAMHTDSHMVTKVKPKVRIIHIFAPEIIKTDVANFRELVQRLTGKPCETDHHRHRVTKTKTRMSPFKKLKTSHSTTDADYQKAVMEQVVQDDNEMIWGGYKKYSSEFFNGFADLSNFMHDFSFESSATSSNIDNVFQESL